MINLKLENNEFEGLYKLTHTILVENTPNGVDYEGKILVEKCLLHNDPENFQERNKTFKDALNEVSPKLKDQFISEQETFQEAEKEYKYLALISSLYLKLIKTKVGNYHD